MNVSLATLMTAGLQFQNTALAKIFLNNIPEKKRAAAVAAYGGSMGADETPVALYDDTMMGSGKSGFFVTEKALYQSYDKKRGPIPWTEVESIQVNLSAIVGNSLSVNAAKLGKLSQAKPAECDNLSRFFQMLAVSSATVPAQQADGSPAQPPMPIPIQQPSSSNQSVAGGFISLIIFGGLIWYFYGGGLETDTARTMQKIENQVANDAVAQYEIAKRNGTAMDSCVQAGFVTAAWLQAENEGEYARWKKVEKADCEAAGVPR